MLLETAVRVNVIGDVVLAQQRNHSVWSDSEIEGWETDPKTSEAFIFDGLGESINNSFIGHFTIWASFHLLELGLDVIEG